MREALAQIRGVVSGLVDAPAWSLADGEVVSCLGAVHQVQQVLAAVQLHLVVRHEAPCFASGGERPAPPFCRSRTVKLRAA